MIKCLIFDLDGTLVDSSGANVRSYSQAFKDVGLVFNPELYRQLFGLRFPEMMSQLAPQASEQQLAKVKSLKAEYYLENIDLVRINGPLLDLIGSTKTHYKTALVTTASRSNVGNLLKHLSIDAQLFDCLIVGEDVEQGKPNPECYIKALQQLNMKPQECLVFEDSEVGYQAATTAGIKVVKVVI